MSGENSKTGMAGTAERIREFPRHYGPECAAGLSCLVFACLTHAFRWFNTMYQHDALLVNQRDFGYQIALGRFLYPLYVLTRGKIVSPPFVGLFGTVFLAAAAMLCVHTLKIRSRLAAAAAGALMAVTETVTILAATCLECFDVQLLALLFASASAFFLLRKGTRSFLLGAGFLTAQLALYQAYIEVTAAVVLLFLLRLLFENERPAAAVRTGLRALGGILAGGLFYGLCLRLLWKVFQSETITASNGLTQLGSITLRSAGGRLAHTYLSFVQYFLRSEILHRQVSAALYILLAVFLIASPAAAACSGRIRKGNALCCGLLVLLLPLALNAVAFLIAGEKHGLMRYAYVFFPVAALLFADALFYGKDTRGTAGCTVREALLCICGILILCHMGYAGQVYTKKALECEAAKSFMTRIVMRMEETEGYVPGQTPVVILGDADENPVVTERGGFRFTDEWLIRDHRMAVSYYQTYELYFANILGYRINLVDIRNVAPYLTLDEVRKMPVFPLPGSVRMVGDTLIVRLSEDIRPQELRPEMNIRY